MRCSSAEWIARNGCRRLLPWDDAIVVSAGKLRKLWDSLSDQRSSVCERRLERQFWGLCHCLSRLRSLLSFPSGMTSHSKIVQLNWVYSALYFWHGSFSASFYRTHTFRNPLCLNQVIKPIILANTSDSPSTWHVLWHPTFLRLTHTVYSWIFSYSQKT
jgi:hypothetical protein